MAKRKVYRSIYEPFEKLKKDEQIRVLWEALGVMQGYNGYSKPDCIAMAMGYEMDEDGHVWKAEDPDPVRVETCPKCGQSV